jgi:hypothetical protein
MKPVMTFFSGSLGNNVSLLPFQVGKGEGRRGELSLKRIQKSTKKETREETEKQLL